MKNGALILAGVIFALVAVVHFARYSKGLTVTIDGFFVPMNWSIYGGVIFTLLAVFMFVALRK
jgi:hypothetical protein